MIKDIYPEWFWKIFEEKYNKQSLPNINPKSKYALILIETREIPGIELIIKNHFEYFSSSVQEPCALEIFCSEKMSHYYKNKLGDGIVCNLIEDEFDYNRLITSSTFWDCLRQRGYKTVLIFQWDSLLLRDYRKDIIDDYAYIGAPWKPEHIDIRGGNGGLSIRNVEEMFNITSRCPYNKKAHGNEDVYFSMFVENSRKLKNSDASQVFVEQVFSSSPLGIHAAYKWQSKENYDFILLSSDICS